MSPPPKVKLHFIGAANDPAPEVWEPSNVASCTYFAAGQETHAQPKACPSAGPHENYLARTVVLQDLASNSQHGPGQQRRTLASLDGQIESNMLGLGGLAMRCGPARGWWYARAANHRPRHTCRRLTTLTITTAWPTTSSRCTSTSRPLCGLTTSWPWISPNLDALLRWPSSCRCDQWCRGSR